MHPQGRRAENILGKSVTQRPVGVQPIGFGQPAGRAPGGQLAAAGQVRLEAGGLQFVDDALGPQEQLGQQGCQRDQHGRDRDPEAAGIPDQLTLGGFGGTHGRLIGTWAGDDRRGRPGMLLLGDLGGRFGRFLLDLCGLFR